MLAGAEAALQGAFSMVAGGLGHGQSDRSLRSTFVDGGGRYLTSPSGADVAACERRPVKIFLAFQEKRVHTADGMSEFQYRGRAIQSADILYIRELISAHPNHSRRSLSRKLCEAWQWRQPNGTLCDMVCRGLLLMLDRAGQITLPPVAYVRRNPLAKRARP